MLLSVTRDVPLQLSAVLGDGKNNQYLVAYISDSAGTAITNVNLSPAGRGKYVGVWTPTLVGYISVLYIPYIDVARTIINTDYDTGEDTFFITNREVYATVDLPDTMYSHLTNTNEYLFILNIISAANSPIAPDVVPTIRILDTYGLELVVETNMQVLLGRAGSYFYRYLVPPGISAVIPLSVEFKSVIGGVTSYNHAETQITAMTASATGNVPIDLAGIADAVWDEILPVQHNILDSASVIAQVTNRNTENTDTYIHNDPNFSLEALRNTMETGDAASLAQVVIVEGKVDALTTQSANETAAILTEVQNLNTMEANLVAEIQASTAALTVEIDANEAILTTQIKPQTDLIIPNPTTAADLVSIDTKLDLKPDTTYVDAAFVAQKLAITGPDDRDNTEIYNNQRGTDNALLATDPRLNFLDASISTRSTVTDASVWSYTSRTLTAAVALNPAGIWDYLTAAATSPGSMGKLIVDNLDAKVSSRSTLSAADLTAGLATTAQEATLVGSTSQVLTAVGLTDTHVLDNKAILNQIKPRTDLIVANGATEANVDIEAAATNVLINTLQTDLNAVKAKTDTLPPNVATETSVQAIPTNPLLTNDPRLNTLNNLIFLDMYVSDVAAQFPTDYAKEATLTASSAQILADIALVDAHVLVLPGTAYFNPQFVKSDSILTGISDIKGAGFTAADSLASIKSSIPLSSTISIDVWTQPARTLTSYPTFATPTDVANAANNTVAALTQYYCGMSTAIDTATYKQHIMCWLVINSKMVLAATDALVTIFKPGDTFNAPVQIWSGTLALPDASGVFSMYLKAERFYGPGLVFNAEVTIKNAGVSYTTVQPFAAVI